MIVGDKKTQVLWMKCYNNNRLEEIIKNLLTEELNKSK